MAVCDGGPGLAVCDAGAGLVVCDGVAAWFCAFRVVGARAQQTHRVSAANWGGIKFIFGILIARGALLRAVIPISVVMSKNKWRNTGYRIFESCRNSGVTESDQHRKTYLLAHRLILFFNLFARA